MLRARWDRGRHRTTGGIEAEGTMVRFLVLLMFLLSGGATAAPLHKATGAMRGATSPGPVIMVAQTAAPEPGELFRDCPDCPEMVVVPSGEFDMGGKDTPFEGPPHRA